MQAMLVDADPERFFVPPYVGHRGWLGVRLDRGLDWDEVAGIAEDAYAEIAPAKLVAQVAERIVTFDVEIVDMGRALAFDLPFDPKEAFGKVRAPVRVTINGFEFRTTVGAMSGRYLIGLNKQVRAGARVDPGDRVAVEIVLDDEPRTVEVPEDLSPRSTRRPARSSTRSRTRTGRSTCAGSRRRSAPRRETRGWRGGCDAPRPCSPPVTRCYALNPIARSGARHRNSPRRAEDYDRR